MNSVILSGRLTNEPDIRGYDSSKTANMTLAVARPYKKDGDQGAEFINCVAFGKKADTVEKLFHKGTKILLRGHIITGSYDSKVSGQKVYTTKVAIDDWEFAESKKNNVSEDTKENGRTESPDDFMEMPEGEDGEFAFN